MRIIYLCPLTTPSPSASRDPAITSEMEPAACVPCAMACITQTLGLSGSEPRTGPTITLVHAAEDLGKNEIALACSLLSPKSR